MNNTSEQETIIHAVDPESTDEVRSRSFTIDAIKAKYQQDVT